MARVRLTHHLKRYFPALSECEIDGTTVAAALDQLDQLHPGISSYLIDDQRSLRKHVNIFINGSLVKDRAALSDPIKRDDELVIMQALSGG